MNSESDPLASSELPTSMSEVAGPDSVVARSPFAPSPAFLAKCFIPYSKDPPTLHGCPIELHDKISIEDSKSDSICLSRVLMERGSRRLEIAFASSTASTLVDATSVSTDVPVTAICSPHLNCLEAVDAAVRHFGHSLEADVIVLDPADLAAGRNGVLGPDLCATLWTLYSRHYQDDSESTDSDQEASSEPQGSPTTATDGNVNLSPEISSFALEALFRGCEGSGRRRIVYFRDYSAFSKAILPILPALLSAALSGPPTVIIVGISPVKRAWDSNSSSVQSKQQRSYDCFIHQLKSNNSIIEYLNWRYAASWRLPRTHSSRFDSLEDVFTTLFLNRYQGRHLKPRPLEHNLKSPFPSKIVFSRAVRIALSKHVPLTLQDVAAKAIQRRFVDANVQMLQTFLSSKDKCMVYQQTDDDLSNIWGALELNELTHRCLTIEQQQNIVASLPTNCNLLDVCCALQAVRDEEKSASEEQTAWQDLVTFAAENAQIIQTKQAVSPVEVIETVESTKPQVDPIVSRVRSDASLSSAEKELLGSIVDPATIKTTFDDVCVSPLVIETMRTAVSLSLLLPEAYSTGILASESVSGILLYGPPGTGKTMACRALAKESNVRMLHIQASSVQSKWVGESEERVVAIFSLARRLGPCIIFIDELDSLFGSRTSDTPEWHSSMMTEFLQEMDGLRSADLNREKGVLVVGATNRPQDLDNAIIRRLPRRIHVGLPDRLGRKHIITQYLRGEDTDDSVDIDALADITHMFSGSDLKHLVLSAALAALKDTLPTSWWEALLPCKAGTPLTIQTRTIRAKHFETALQEISASCAKDPRNLAELERWSSGLGGKM